MVITIVINGIRNQLQSHPDGFFSLLAPYEDNLDRDLEIHLSGTEELPEQISLIKTFCQNNQLDEKQLYYIELFVEEITVFIIEKGFTDARKKEIDIRVYIDSEDVIIRTRDNGNPITVMERREWLEKLQEGDYMGIRMVYKLAQKMQYITTMNINNFIVTLPKRRNQKYEKN